MEGTAAPSISINSTTIAWLVVGALTAFFGAVNWQWLRANVVTYGWDRMDHLITSLAYNNILQRITPQSLFDALAFADYYPPLVHFGMVFAYRLFGVDEDIAAMTNVVYLALLLGATWTIAKRAGGTRVALLATIITGTFPMIFMMARYLYLDFALTALVAVALAFLLASERFTRRGASLLFGLALGLAFLVKWTAAAFLAAPLLYILWRGGVIAALLRRPALLIPDWKRLLVAFGTSGAAIGAWLLPARASVEQNRTGLWLVPVLLVLFGFVVYALMAAKGERRKERAAGEETGDGGETATMRGRVANALSAGAVGAFVMSLWYAINTEFIAGFFYTAYGREEGRFLAFDKYFYEVVTEQLGPMYSIALAAVATAWLLRWLTSGRRSPFPFLRSLSDTQWVLLLWAIVPYVVFSAGVSLAHSRFLMPFLPPLAIWLSLGLWRIRHSVLRIACCVTVLGLAVGQFGLLSFEAFAETRERLVLETPAGQVNLLAHGFFIQNPASGDTDPSYAIAPTVLDIAEQARVAQGREFINVGVLVNSHQLHEKHFLYQIYTRYPNVLLRELARNWSEQPAYAQLFEMDYVLVSDTHSYRTSRESQVVIERLLHDESDLFNRAFRPVEQWNFLSGENVTLYERRFAPTVPGPVVEDYQAVVQAMGGEIGTGDAVVLVAPDQAYIAGLTFPDGTGAKFIPLESAEGLDEMIYPHGLFRYNRVFLLSHNAGQSDPGGEIEHILREKLIAGSEQWFGAVRVTPFVQYEFPDEPKRQLDAEWETGTRLEGFTVAASGFDVGARLHWDPAGESPQKVSVQLLAPDGTLIAQQDADLGPEVQDFALLVPRGVDYWPSRLVITLYDPTTLERYAASDGATSVELVQFGSH